MVQFYFLQCICFLIFSDSNVTIVFSEMKKSMKGLHDIMADFYEDFWPQAREFQVALQVRLK